MDDSLEEGYAVKTASTGTLKWRRPSGSGEIELRDSGRVVVAKGSTRDPKQLEVYVQADEMNLDVWLSS
ncbi:hypothetical protein LTR09_005258 [Extremus antarcticus]|uniref:Uncharacterized protein n=1 Tax=Extremus antarcticus TaxID=702011 RepID=A0AAJ0G8N8_9PEZI|nr:hypothetical protein LTR09_005258 [Extremus antarcticus]